jgi:hypothetical protein
MNAITELQSTWKHLATVETRIQEGTKLQAADKHGMFDVHLAACRQQSFIVVTNYLRTKVSICQRANYVKKHVT